MTKKNKFFISIGILLSIFCAFTSLQAEKQKSRKDIKKELNPEYSNWLNLIHHIITPTELDVFFKLTNNRDRKTFINLFWKLRDPSKGTPQNEFKEEHITRYKYANRYYKHGSPLPGWKTDRGKIHILLGPPVSREEITQQNGLRPVEIWEYFGGVEKGLPSVFRMVFYKPHGAGAFKQYVPAIDGPAALLRTGIGKFDTNDHYQVYKEIQDLNPTIADISLTLIPGEPLHNFAPSLRGPILMSKIYEYPKKKIKTSYAKNFLNFRGIVKTYVNTDYISTTSDIYLLKDPTLKLNFIHIALRPERVSVGYLEEEDKYFLNIILTIVLKKGENVILQYDKSFSLYYSKEELDLKISHGLIFTEHFPIIEGKFKLLTILQNSLNREISYNEKEIDTTKINTMKPKAYRPLISYNKVDSKIIKSFSPFNVAGRNIKIDPKRIFGLKESLTTLICVEKGNYNEKLKVEMEVKSLDERRKYQKNYSFEYPAGKSIWYFKKDLDKLKYGNYIVKIKLIGKDGIVLSSNVNDFQIFPRAYVPHPPIVSKNLKIENRFIFFLTLAKQYQQDKNYKKAEFFYEKAFSINSTFPPLLQNYASFLFSQKKYKKILFIIKELKNQEKELFHYLALKGRVLYFQKKYNESIDILLKANKIYDSDTTVLNSLGFSFVKIGNKEEAIKVLSASLKVNHRQKNILNIITQLKNNKNNQDENNRKK